MIPNQILKVLSIFRKNKVKALLIGGQACIAYGAAEFSRDTDFVIFLDPDNIINIKKALNYLQAKQVFLPPLEIDYLKRGHGCHFRCGLDEVKDMRIDIMAKLRGCSAFNNLWKRRKTIDVGGCKIDIIGLSDLVRCKKTQRDKDWFMLKRLVEIDILKFKGKISVKKIKWWLYECRNPETLVDLVKKYPDIARVCLEKRPLIKYAFRKDIDKLNILLIEEEQKERSADKDYWMPLRRELEQLRRKRKII